MVVHNAFHKCGKRGPIFHDSRGERDTRHSEKTETGPWRSPGPTALVDRIDDRRATERAVWITHPPTRRVRPPRRIWWPARGVFKGATHGFLPVRHEVDSSRAGKSQQRSQTRYPQLHPGDSCVFHIIHRFATSLGRPPRKGTERMQRERKRGPRSRGAAAGPRCR